MKKFLNLLLVLSFVLTLASCSCGHKKTTDATCDEAAKCKECGEFVGQPTNDHDWVAATCVKPEICKSCGKTRDEATGKHVWKDATCYEPKTCETCGKTEGEKIANHTWVDADCENPIRCETCDDTEGEPLGHTWIEATYDEPKTCTTCNKTEGSPKVRPAFEATLKKKAPLTITNYFSSGKKWNAVTFNDIRVSYESGYNGKRIVLYFSGQKTYDYEGSRNSSSCQVAITVYDEDGYVVADDSYYTHDLKVGDKFKDDKCVIYDELPDGIYTIEIAPGDA